MGIEPPMCHSHPEIPKGAWCRSGKHVDFGDLQPARTLKDRCLKRDEYHYVVASGIEPCPPTQLVYITPFKCDCYSNSRKEGYRL